MKLCETCAGHRYYLVPTSFADDPKADTLVPCPDCNLDGEATLRTDPPELRDPAAEQLLDYCHYAQAVGREGRVCDEGCLCNCWQGSCPCCSHRKKVQ